MKKVGELKKHIYLCNSHEEHLLGELEALNMRKRLNLLTRKQYKKQLTALLRGRSVDDWLNYYKEYKGNCFKMIEEHDRDLQFRGIMFVLLLLVLVMPFGLNYTGYGVVEEKGILVDKMVSSDAYLIIDGIASPIPLTPEFSNGQYVYRIRYLDLDFKNKLEIMDNNLIVFSLEK